MANFDRSIYGKAADVLREQGWTQGTIRDDDGRLCLLGALAKVGMVDGVEPWAELALQLPGFSVAIWNDAPERTADDVFLLLKYAEADELPTWQALYGPEAES